MCKGAVMVTAPLHIEDLIRWYRHEWAEETPARLHGQDTEPDSALGSPRLNGDFRRYLMASPMATDHDDRLDSTTKDDAPLFPIHAALHAMARRWPWTARYLFAITWCGVDWQDVALSYGLTPEIGYHVTHSSLSTLYRMWERGRNIAAA